MEDKNTEKISEKGKCPYKDDERLTIEIEVIDRNVKQFRDKVSTMENTLNQSDQVIVELMHKFDLFSDTII